jgi:ribokinase
MKKCAVIGSINMDMVVNGPRFPRPGETLTGTAFQTVPGGKGANQAIALAKLGVPVTMFGRVGDDAFGREYLEHFKRTGVQVSGVSVAKEAPTGVAMITVTPQGENAIMVVPGANGTCTEAWLEEILPQVAEYDIILLQLEIPIPTVKQAIEKLHAIGKTIILDPAPAVPLEKEWLEQVDYVTPNESELCILTGDLPEDAKMEERIHHLVEESDRIVIHKRGGEGAFIGRKHEITAIPGYQVQVVDTTAAGDTFNAGFAAGLCMGKTLEESVRLGNAAGALAVTKAGAQAGMPTMEQAIGLQNSR